MIDILYMVSESNKDDKLKEIEEAIDSTTSIIEKTAKVSSDGRQVLVRFPSKISEALGIKKGDKIKFTAEVDKENPENNDLKVEHQKVDEDDEKES
ncbi:MAG: hypothetical protein ABEJ07_03065 [Candidatus Nanohaloarchaea archaeon]